jgi:hypothetical protein
MITRDLFKENPGPGRLKGKTVFLSASIPSRSRDRAYQVRYAEESIPDDWIEIEQAVIGLSRAIFSEEGRLVFGGHPTITPIIASVASEYFPPRPPGDTGGAEKDWELDDWDRYVTPVVVYQSRAFRGYDKSWLLHRLGYAEVRWTRRIDNEQYDAELAKSKPPCPKSVEHMRRVMLSQTKPDAMVCVGGMEGVEAEAGMFRSLVIEATGEKPKPWIYVLATTGGAAKIMADDRAVDPNDRIRVIDKEVLAKVGMAEPEFVPYAVIMQTIVNELSTSA